MNNSKIAYESILTLDEPDNSELYREKQTILIKIIEAIDELNKSAEWSILKKEIFDSRVDSLERQMKYESEKPEIKDSDMYRLQGRLFEARKYDLTKLRESSLIELNNIKRLTQPTER